MGRSARAEADVYAVLSIDGPGHTPASVFAEVKDNGIALVTVRHALRALVRAGLVRYVGPDGRRKYWRTANGTNRA